MVIKRLPSLVGWALAVGTIAMDSKGVTGTVLVTTFVTTDETVGNVSDVGEETSTVGVSVAKGVSTASATTPAAAVPVTVTAASTGASGVFASGAMGVTLTLLDKTHQTTTAKSTMSAPIAIPTGRGRRKPARSLLCTSPFQRMTTTVALSAPPAASTLVIS